MGCSPRSPMPGISLQADADDITCRPGRLLQETDRRLRVVETQAHPERAPRAVSHGRPRAGRRPGQRVSSAAGPRGGAMTAPTAL